MGIIEGGLAVITLLMRFLPAGTKAYEVASAGRAAIEAMQAEGRNPTVEEFEAELTAVMAERAHLHSDDA